MVTCNHPKSAKAKRCRSCNCKAQWADPHFRARKARSNAATLAKLRQDPAFVEREKARQAEGLRKMIASRRQQEPDVIARRVATFRSRKLGWCPPHLRDEYIHIMKNKHLSAERAREIILAQWDAELSRRQRAA